MGLYNFQKRFVGAVLDGSKTHTIRGRRANPDKPGSTLHLYTGLRQKGARLLMRVPCTKVEEIEIRQWTVRVNHEILFADECQQLAKRDGFTDFDAMMKFWEGRLPFDGHIVHWKFPGEVA